MLMSLKTRLPFSYPGKHFYQIKYMLTNYVDGFSKATNPSKKNYDYTHTVGIIYFLYKKHFGMS